MVAALPEQIFDVEAFLAEEQGKGLLRFTTAGSVDDGKSTLIGRLLYDSKGVYEDQLRSVKKASANRSAGEIDFSLLTDGLRAEREQGITIDVAYRYFSTARRKFIIADTPGHEQYTRNMATGASTADLAIVLIDARNGVLPQSRRHAYIASLLGIPQIVVAVNKMDLVGYDAAVFEAIEREFTDFLSKLGGPRAYFLPISALAGENVVRPSGRMPWYRGPSLLEYLETVEIAPALEAAFRFPVQRAVRPDQHFRGYAGQIASGSIRPGDSVLAFPSGSRTRVKSISTFDGDLDIAHAPMSVTLTLTDELDIGRGDLISGPVQLPSISRRFEATIIWFSAVSLDASRPYLLKHCNQTVKAEIQSIHDRVNLTTLIHEPASTFEMNAIGAVSIETSRHITLDAYGQNRVTGSFILIDPATNATVAAGMIARPLAELPRRAARVTTADRIARYGHRSAVISVSGRVKVAELLERQLFDRGCSVAILPYAQPEAIAALEHSGSIVVVVAGGQPSSWPVNDEEAAQKIMRQLEEDEILLRTEQLSAGEGI